MTFAKGAHITNHYTMSPMKLRQTNAYIPDAGQGWVGMMPQASRKGNDKKLHLARVELATFSVWG